MAGLGRRTHYRKHLTDSVLHDLPEPNPPHSQVAKIVATRGSNQFDVKLANSKTGQQELAILPTKFRKLVWLKRNDYVIVETVHEEDDNDHNDVVEASAPNNNDSGGIRCMISHILYQDQIKHLIAKGIWPMDDPDFVVDDRKMMDAGNNQQPQAAEDGIVYDDAYLRNDGNLEGEEEEEGVYGSEEDALSGDDPLLFVNTNRLARLTVQDSSSDEDEDDD